jgi:hypothetical protein
MGESDGRSTGGDKFRTSARRRFLRRGVAESHPGRFRVVNAAARGVIRPMKVAFISGTSIVNSTLFSAWEVKTVETQYGPVTYKTRGDHVLINRHGYKFPLPPHSINYRANIRALADLGFHDVVSLNSVGSLKKICRRAPSFVQRLRRAAAGPGDIFRHGAQGWCAGDRQQPDSAARRRAGAGVHDPPRQGLCADARPAV